MQCGWWSSAAGLLGLALLGCQMPDAGSDAAERGGSNAATPLAGSGAAATGGAGATAGTDGAVTPNMPGTAGATGAAGSSATNDGGSGSEPMHVVPPTPLMAEPCSVSGCPPGLECEASGVCVTPPPECTADVDCGGMLRCGLTGECLEPGACRVRGDCAEAEACRADQCVVGSDCGQTELVIEPIPPNLLVLLDISGSMSEGLDGELCFAIPGLNTCPPTKIAIASGALTQMTVSYRDDLYWGLAMFPGDGACGAPASVLAPAPGNADMVSNTVAATFPAGTTPINAAIASVQSSMVLTDAARKNYLLLLSDGAETCGGDNANTTQRIADMAAIGIGTFVVGFGGGVDATVLDNFAVAGGMPNTASATKYFQADSAAELQSALGTILQRVVGCDFALASPPDDPDAVWAFLDDVQVERDIDDGWSLDTAANVVTFAGASCAALQTGEATDIDVVFGCPEPVLE
jgi:hypothetical protein